MYFLSSTCIYNVVNRAYSIFDGFLIRFEGIETMQVQLTSHE